MRVSVEVLHSKYRNPNSIYFKFRAARSRHVRDLINDIFARRGRVRILDLGGSPEYWQVFPEGYLASRNATVSLLNLYPQQIDSGPFIAIAGDACAVNAENQSYDLVHSNSVIEHVGSAENMERFAAEVRRLAPAYYVQTPNFWFPYEPHMRAPLIHWLPRFVQARLVLKLQLDAQHEVADLSTAYDYLALNRLITSGVMRALFPDAAIKVERFAGLTKSMMAIRPAY